MIVSRARPLGAEVRLIQRFDDSFTELWEERWLRIHLAVRRDAAYLNWKFVSAPHVRYFIAALRRDNRNVGYAVYRHCTEPRGRVTLLVDFLTDPDDEAGFRDAPGWVDREARQADSDKIRTFVMHAGFRRVLQALRLLSREVLDGVRGEGQRVAVHGLLRRHRRWHVTLGDSDQDR